MRSGLEQKLVMNQYEEPYNGIARDIKNRNHSPSSESSHTYSGGLLTAKSLEQNDRIKIDGNIGIDIWKQSMKDQTDDPFKLYPLSNHPSPQQADYRIPHNHSQIINENSSLLPQKNSIKKSPSWWRRYVTSDDYGKSEHSFSSSSSSSNQESPTSSFIWWRPLKRRLKTYTPQEPYYFEKVPTKNMITPPPPPNNSIFNQHYKASKSIFLAYSFHYFSTAIYDITIPHNIWLSKRGLFLNPWIGPSPITLSKFGVLNTAKIISSREYWRIFTSITLSSNLTQLVLNALAIQLIIAKVEREWGSKIITLIYLSSSLIAALITTTFRPYNISTCSSAGIVAIVSFTMIISFSSKYDSRIIQSRKEKRHRKFSRRKLIFSLIVLCLNVIIGICPMVGFIPQLCGIVIGCLMGLIFLTDPMMEYAEVKRSEHNKYNHRKVPSYPFAQAKNLRSHNSYVDLDMLSPDSPITRRSLILSPDEEKSEISPLTSTSRQNQAKRNPLIDFFRWICIFILGFLFVLPIVAIASDRIQTLSYMENPLLTNCVFMRSIQNDEWNCEQTCVPYAGVPFAIDFTSMEEGRCKEVGYQCHIEDSISTFSANSSFDMSYSGYWNLNWSWNTEYNPIVSIFTKNWACGDGSGQNYSNDDKNDDENIYYVDKDDLENEYNNNEENNSDQDYDNENGGDEEDDDDNEINNDGSNDESIDENENKDESNDEAENADNRDADEGEDDRDKDVSAEEVE